MQNRTNDETPHNKYADDFKQLKQVEKPVDTQKPGISDQGAAGGLSSYGTAPPPPKDGDKTPPSIAGTPIQGTDVGLEHDPEGVRVSTITGPDGAYQFTGLPAGKYKLSLPGHLFPSIIALTVGADGSATGSVMRGSDGTVGIFDRWGNSLAISVSKTDNNSTGSKAAGTPFGFGSSNTTITINF